MQKLTAADATAPPDVKRAKYRQLADAIRAQIADGYLRPGEKLPPIGELAAMTGVASSVVRQALGILEQEGAIEQRKGVAAKVTDTMQVTPAGQVREMSMARYVEQNVLMAEGKRPDTSAFVAGHNIAWDDYDVAFDVVNEQATPKDRELLRLPVGARVWRRSFLKYVAGVPVEIQQSVMPEWVVEGNLYMIDPSRQPYMGGTQWELFDGGFHVAHVYQETVTRMPTEIEERQLRIRRTPVLASMRVMSIMHAGKLRPCEASRVILTGANHRLIEQVALRKVDTRRKRG